MENNTKINPAVKIILSTVCIFIGLCLMAYGVGYAFGKIEKLFF